MLGETFLANLCDIAWGNYRPLIDHNSQKKWVRFSARGNDLNGHIINLLHRIGQKPLIAPLELGVLRTFPGKDHRVGIERFSVMEGDSLAQMEGVLRAIIGDFPTFGQGGHNFAVVVNPNQRII